MDVQKALKPLGGMSKSWDVAGEILSMVCKGEALEHTTAFLASVTRPKLSQGKCPGQKRVSEHVFCLAVLKALRGGQGTV